MKFILSSTMREPTIVSVELTAAEIKKTKVIRFPSVVDGTHITKVNIDEADDFADLEVKIEFEEGIFFCGGFSSFNVTEVTFPSSIEIITSNAFCGCQKLKKVNFPMDSRLSTICSYAFSETAIEELILPASLTTIESNAFQQIKSLQKVAFEDRICCIKNIGGYAFASNQGLKSVEIPETRGFISFDTHVFHDCSSLECVDFKDNNVSAFSSHMFENCLSLKSLTIPNSLRVIGQGAFMYSSISSFDCSECSLELIDVDAFAWTKLETISLPETVTCIADGAFKFTPLKKIRLPEYIKRIESNAFLYSGLTEIENMEQLSDICYLGDSVFMGCDFEELSIPYIEAALDTADLFSCNNSLESLTFEEGATQVCKNMFRACRKLKSIKLSTTVEHIDDSAFLDCEKLSDIEWNKSLKLINNNAFENTNIEELTLNAPELRINDDAFKNCSQLSTIILSPYIIYSPKAFPKEAQKKLESAKLF